MEVHSQLDYPFKISALLFKSISLNPSHDGSQRNYVIAIQKDKNLLSAAS